MQHVAETDFATLAQRFRTAFEVVEVTPAMRHEFGLGTRRAQVAAPRASARAHDVAEAERAFAGIEYLLWRACEHDALLQGLLRWSGLDLIDLLERERETCRRYVAGGARCLGALLTLLRTRARTVQRETPTHEVELAVEDRSLHAAELRVQMLAALAPARHPRYAVILRAMLDQHDTAATQQALLDAGLGTLSPAQLRRDQAAIRTLIREAFRPREPALR